jgi:hypothetical protein
MEDHVFICYAREDEQFVLTLAGNLKSRGVPVWLNRWDIPAGANWQRSIDKAIQDCAKFLIVLSPAAIDSEEVKGELWTALDEQKPIVPVLHKPCRILLRLRQRQYVDFTGNTHEVETALAQLLGVLGGKQGEPGQSSPRLPHLELVDPSVSQGAPHLIDNEPPSRPNPGLDRFIPSRKSWLLVAFLILMSIIALYIYSPVQMPRTAEELQQGEPTEQEGEGGERAGIDLSNALVGFSCDVSAYGGSWAEVNRQLISGDLYKLYGCSAPPPGYSKPGFTSFRSSSSPFQGFASRSTVLYYHSANKSIAEAIARDLSKKYKHDFIADTGRGQEVRPEWKKRTIIVHLREEGT